MEPKQKKESYTRLQHLDYLGSHPDQAIQEAQRQGIDRLGDKKLSPYQAAEHFRRTAQTIESLSCHPR